MILTAASLSAENLTELPARAQGQSLPLHGVPRNRGRDPWVKSIEEPAWSGSSASAWQRQRQKPSSQAKPDTTLDVAVADLLHLKLLRSPHAHARIGRSAKTAPWPYRASTAVFTWEDVPRLLYTTANHDDYHSDPDDTYILDDRVRFVGQRVAAVVAETEGAAEEGCRELEVEFMRYCRRSLIPRRRCDPERADSSRQWAQHLGSSVPAATFCLSCTAA
jgi:hypothetical protein